MFSFFQSLPGAGPGATIGLTGVALSVSRRRGKVKPVSPADSSRE